MPRVATFCPRCGESIDTELPEEAKAMGRAELACPSCRFRFVIAPAQGAPGGRPEREESGQSSPPRAAGSGPAGQGPPGETTDERGASAREQESGPESAVSPDAPGTQAEPRYPEAAAARAQRSGPSGALPARLLSAGILLVFAATLGLWIGSSLVFGGVAEDVVSGTSGQTTLEGVVLQPGGQGMAGVEVQLLEAVDGRPDRDTPAVATNVTDAGGGFEFQGVEGGSNWVRVELAGYETAIVEMIAFAQEGAVIGNPALVNMVNLQEGDPEQVDYDSIVELFRTIALVVGWGILIASLGALMSAVLVFTRRGFALAVTGAVAGIFSVGFAVGSVMAIIALVILLFSKREFRPLRRKEVDSPQGR